MGEELKGIIAEKVRIQFKNGYEQSAGDFTISDALRKIVAATGKNDINPYLHAGWSIADGMPQAPSIDNYLNTHSDDEKVVLMGKLGIAMSILHAEKGSKIFCNPQVSDRILFGSIPESWHATFCKILMENVKRSNIENMFDDVAFITFNYDRCIEHYLAQALANYLRMPHNEAQALVNRVNIIHPYGQVGRLPWQTNAGQGVPYGALPHSANLVEIAAQIRTFTERVDDDTMLERMRGVIAEAEMVVYLGFSYGDMNMELMSIREEVTPRHVLGTSFGLSHSNKRVIERDIRNAMGPTSIAVTSLELADMTCNDLLNAYQRFILRG